MVQLSRHTTWQCIFSRITSTQVVKGFDMVTRIYVWKPSSMKSFGHIALELSDGTYVSWWPREQLSSIVDAITGTQAKWYENFQSELEENGNPTKTYNMSGLNQDKIKKFFKNLLRGSRRWDLMMRSCSNVIYHALCEGSEWFEDRAGQTTTPEAVAQLAEAYIENKTDIKIKFASFCK